MSQEGSGIFARSASGAAVIWTLLTAIPPSVEACSCGGTVASAPAFRASMLVFVGTVERVDQPQSWWRTNSDGSITGGSGTGPRVVTFVVTRAFRGVAETRIRITGNSAGSCGTPFRVDETWLVYASDQQGRGIEADACSRTRLLSEAGEDLKYLEGLAVGRPQALVYGDVHQQIVGPDGKPAFRALFEPLQVVAVGTAGRFAVTTDRWGPYQIVLPPGDFQLRVERQGRQVTALVTVRVGSGDERQVAFAAQFDSRAK
jgi:hypothetical protein